MTISIGGTAIVIVELDGSDISYHARVNLKLLGDRMGVF